MSTTRIKQQLQTIVAELRDTLPPDKLALANQVHDMTVAYRRECAELRKQAEEAASRASSAAIDRKSVV